MSASRRKGTAAETAVVRWLREHGFPFAERRALAGRSDRGDIAGIGGWALEVKSCKRMELAVWMDEAKAEGVNDGSSNYAVIHKRIGKGNPADWYVTLPLSVFAEVIR